MTESDAKIIIGSLLHDIGKVIYQDENESKTLGQSGYDYLKNIVGVNDQTILDCVRYSDKKALKSAVSDICDSVYITYMADSIASLKDKDEVDKEVDEMFKIHSPLRPVFNILNNNCSDMYYSPSVSNAKQEINYPVNEKRDYSKDDYSKISEVLKNNISHMTYTNDYISLLLDCLENTLSYIPASCDKKEDSDISLYDHLKMSAAYASCISKYVESNGYNLKETLIDKYDDFYKEDAFLLSALDISGIQSFIYTISTKNALKTLRARSFYLEILMEHVIDEILDRLGLSRTNLIYSGGGHCYILLPNTGDSKLVFDQSVKEVNEWFLNQYGSSLYIAGSYVECSADDLKNNPKGSYSCIYKELSANLATKKLRRYDADQIRFLNNQNREDYSRECSVCRNTGIVDDEGVCARCRSLENFSKSVCNLDCFPVKDSGKLKYYEYALSLDVKRKRGELGDYIRGITPLVLELFRIILKDRYKIDVYEYCSVQNVGKDKKSGSNRIYKWDEKKLKDTKVLEMLNKRYPGGFRCDFLKSDHLCHLIQQQDDIKPETSSDIGKLREIEFDIRNAAAHEMIRIDEDFIKTNTSSKSDSKEIFSLIKKCMVFAGVSKSDDAWDTYEKMNDMIIQRI